jgi:diguanylate cyclase (GGDEF)-like protein
VSSEETSAGRSRIIGQHGHLLVLGLALQITLLVPEYIFASQLIRNSNQSLVALIVLLLAGFAILFGRLLRQHRIHQHQREEMLSRLNAEREALERRIEERTSELQREVEERRRAEQLTRGRHQVLELLTREAPMSEVLHALAKTVADYNSIWGCALHLCEGDRLRLKAIADIPERLVAHIDIFLGEHDGAPEQLAFQQGSPVIIVDLWKELKPWTTMLTAHGVQSAWSVPILSAEKQSLGTLTVYSRLLHSPSPEELNVIQMAAQMAALVLNHRFLHEQLFKSAYHDSLTGIPNRRFGNDWLSKAISLAQREGKSVAVLWMDVDHFKQINDVHGHPAGDAVLREVASRVRKRLRASDTVARMGGDEFMVVLQSLESPEDAMHIASEVLELLCHPVELGPLKLPLHVSMGVALYPTDGDTTESLERLADHAMYRAKKGNLGIACASTLETVSPEPA